ncbi:hypothetical protein DCC79_04620 [bacterium]|nr:MAG: hypothetical protein DCC79_04620 [bacterium]
MMITRRKLVLVTPARDRRIALARALTAAGFDVQRAAAVPATATADVAVVRVPSGGAWPTAEQLAEIRTVLIVDNADAMRQGFDLGAEDCVLADAHADEIVARCEAVARRTDLPGSVDATEEPAIYVDRRLWVNFNSRQVWVNGRAAHLTPREFRLLAFLIEHHDATLGHDQILEAVWGRLIQAGRPTEVLKQYVWRLRQKIETDPNQPEIVVTDPGAGYRFISRQD